MAEENETLEQETGNEQELDQDFADFVENYSKHDFTKEQEQETANTVKEEVKTEGEQAQGSQAPEQKTTFASNSTFDNFKLQMFVGIFFGLLDGLHFFVYSFISKHKLEKEDLAFDEDDREAVTPYFKTDKIMALINKLPNELIGIIHIEWIYHNKYKEAIEDKKEEEAERLLEEEEEAEREKKRKARKRTKKKKPAKKKAE